MPLQARPYEFAPAIRQQAEKLRVTSYREAIRGSIAAHSITADKIAVGVLNVGSGAVTIDNGAITADKLNVASLSAITATLGSVTAGDITATDIHGGTITGTALLGGTIDGYTITGGNLNGSNINGVVIAGSDITSTNTITGALITGAVIRTAVTNERMVVTSTDFRAYDANNHEAFRVDWTTPTGDGVEVNLRYRRSWAFAPGFRWYDDSASGQLYAYITGAYDSTAGGYSTGIFSGVNGCAMFFNDGDEKVYVLSGNSTANTLVDNSGDMVAHHYLTFSDESFKTRVKPLGSSLASIRKLRPVRYRAKASGREHLGFTAQDVQSVLPEAVGSHAAPAHPETGEREWEGERLSLDMMAILSASVAATQELADRVEALEHN